MIVPLPAPDPSVQHRARALDRISEHGGFSSYLRYHRLNSKEVESVHCKCGMPIRGLVDDDSLDEHKVLNGQRVLIRRVIFMDLPTKATVELTFDDGSRHTTDLCTTCADALVTACEGCCDLPEDARTVPLTVEGQEAETREVHPHHLLDRIYCHDLFQWLEQEHRGMGPVHWGHDGHLSRRRPISVRRLSARGED